MLIVARQWIESEAVFKSTAAQVQINLFLNDNEQPGVWFALHGILQHLLNEYIPFGIDVSRATAVS